MKLPHLFKRHDAADTEAALDASAYDAEVDLARPHIEAADAAANAYVPYGGQLAPTPPQAGYDVLRDTGVEPG